MFVHKAKPGSLEGRSQQNSVAVRCEDCSIDLLWPISAGNAVTCPSCNCTHTLDFTGVKVIDPTVK